jgi:multimeric flavodoxin WrbA
MKTILGIICSPRKLGNCEIAVKEISRKIKEPHTLKLIRLSKFNLGQCKGCYACLVKGKCVIKDDLNLIIDAFIAADAFIISAPTYCLGANASLKLLADRGLAFFIRMKEFWNKPAVGIGIAGLEGKEGYTKLNLDSFMRIFLMKVKASKILYGALPGEVRINESNDALLTQAAESLFGDAVKPSGPVCPLCGGDTFRFLGKDQLRCMLCSNAGTITFSDNTPSFDVRLSDHELFLTNEDAMHHGQWLEGMKEKFKGNKDDLKKITHQYKGQGEWITPEKQ